MHDDVDLFSLRLEECVSGQLRLVGRIVVCRNAIHQHLFTPYGALGGDVEERT
ncbi:Uncharacterised protein [Mycobacteroides abscessus subsp. abscessus]|nr:Uncharacterised protein [Mycobacteroides abscessus subsp. abscessus]